MKIRVPLIQQRVAGIDCPFPQVTLRVRDRHGALAVLRFRVDTAADFAAIPIPIAQREAIPFRENIPEQVRGLSGVIGKFRDRLRVVIAGREHEWPCDFVKEPLPQEPGQPLSELTPVLGRAGFLDEYALSIDSRYLILTRLGPLRRWWRRRIQWLWARFGLVHSPNQPL
jgi:hypothetical protein